MRDLESSTGHVLVGPFPGADALQKQTNNTSAKAYKFRLKQAGLMKNITLKKPEEVQEALRLLADRQTGRSSRASVVTTAEGVKLANGRTVTFEKLAEHLRRKGVFLPTVQGGCTTSSRPSPWTSHLDAPQSLHIVEQIFIKTWEYKSRRLDIDTQEPGRRGTLDYKSPFDTVMYSRDLLRQGNFQAAVALLRLAPGQLRQLLQAHPPRTLDFIYNLIVTIVSAPESAKVQIQMIVSSLIRYLAEICTEIVGLSPDLCVIFRLLSQVGLEEGSQLYDTAVRARKCMLDLEEASCKFLKLLASSNDLMLTDMGLTLDSSTVRERMNVAQRWCQLGAVAGYHHLPTGWVDKVQAEYEQNVARFGRKSQEAMLPLCVLVQFYGQKSVVSGSTKDIEMAQQGTDEVLEILAAETIPFNARERLIRRRDLYWGLSAIYFMKRNPASAEKYMRLAIHYGIALDGPYAESVFRFRIQLLGFFRIWSKTTDNSRRAINDAGILELEGKRQEYLDYLQEQIRISNNNPQAEGRYVTALHATWPSVSMFRPIGMEV